MIRNIHDIKIERRYFNSIKEDRKTWELRYNDRDYHAGDYLLLREVEFGKYTGNMIIVMVMMIQFDYKDVLKDGWIIMSIEKVDDISVDSFLKFFTDNVVL